MDSNELFEFLGFCVVASPTMLLAALGLTALIGWPLTERKIIAWTYVTTMVGLLASLVILAMMLFIGTRHVVLEFGNLVLIEEQHIKAVLDEAPKDFSGEVINLPGKWLIPGLLEMHTHSYGNQIPGGVAAASGTPLIGRLMLNAGVTGFLDLFGAENLLVTQREQQRQGKLIGADMYASLSCLTATKGHCTEYGTPTRTMDTPEQAEAVVRDLAKKNPDVIKIVYSQNNMMPTVSKETLYAALATANELGIKTVIHIDSLADMRDAIEGGASALTHLPRSEAMTQEIAQLMASKNVVSIPTLAVYMDGHAYMSDSTVLSAPLAVKLYGEDIQKIYAAEGSRYSEAQLATTKQRNQLYLGSTKMLAD